MPTLNFDSGAHTYELNGVHVPSVTQVLSPYTGLEFVDPDVLQRAAQFGNHVHDACHLFNIDELDWMTLDDALTPYVRAWADFLEDSGAVVIKSEHRVYSERHKFAGTLDVLVDWKRRTRLIDLKSTASVPKTVGPQTAAYAEAHTEMTGQYVSDRYCLHLKPDGKYKAHKLDDRRDWTIFQSCLNVYNWYYNKR